MNRQKAVNRLDFNPKKEKRSGLTGKSGYGKTSPGRKMLQFFKAVSPFEVLMKAGDAVKIYCLPEQPSSQKLITIIPVL